MFIKQHGISRIHPYFVLNITQKKKKNYIHAKLSKQFLKRDFPELKKENQNKKAKVFNNIVER